MALGRVLFVSEDASVLESLATILRCEDYHVLAVGQPSEAARLLPSFAPEVLVVDLGTQDPMLEELLYLRRCLRIPLLIITSTSRDDIDADASLVHPILIPELLAQMHCLRRKQAPFVLMNGRDRRYPSRPKRGDVRPCARCGYAMRFEEPGTAPPAWMCRNSACLSAEFVRAEP
jgi:DNA-binding response OmpR family regulator